MMEEKIIKTLKNIFDHEIPVNIYDLGLIYKIDIQENNDTKITMTLTSPNCPVADSLPLEVKEKVKEVEGINDAEVEITFDPPWSQDMISEEARLELGFL